MLFLIEYIHLFFDFLVESIFAIVYYRTPKRIVEEPRNNIVNLSALELANYIRTNKYTSEQVVQAFINRINAVNGTINAVVDTRFEEALDEAREVDADIRAGRYSEQDWDAMPLLGVPFTTKESVRCEGMRATFALKSRENCRSVTDAAVIANVKKAGAILIAVTNIPQMNMWVDSFNPVYGTSNNPYDSTRSVGGSSGGEAALVAAAGTGFSVGSDIGGSIRIPSYMCGVFGHKTSNGLIDVKGIGFRETDESETTMVCSGPIARHACDLALGVKVILGDQAQKLRLDTPVIVENLQFFYVDTINDLRCSPVRGDVKYAFNMVVKHLSTISTVEKLSIPEFSQSNSIYKYWLAQERTNFASDITNRKSQVDALSELIKYVTFRSEFCLSVIYVLLTSQYMPCPEDGWSKDVTERLRNALLEKLSVSGVLIFPSWPTVPQQHHVDYLRPYNFAYTAIFNVLKLPVTQVPLGLSAQGLPLGLQVVAAPMQDHLCLAVAQHLEAQFGGYVAPWAGRRGK